MDLQFKREWTIPSAIGVACFLIGTGAGYILKDLLNKEELVEEDDQLEIDWEATNRHTILQLAQDVRTLMNEFDAAVVDAVDLVTTMTAAENTQTEYHNVFPRGTEIVDTWDIEAEKAQRKNNSIYVISREEYEDGATEFKQHVLTYYEKDAMLCDENDNPILKQNDVVGDLKFGHGSGDINLKFGHGSGDINVVYVRNETLQGEYEIVKYPGYYQEEVLGQTRES